jgi:hypothetical protein
MQVRHTEIVGARGDIVAVSGCDGGLVDHVVRWVGCGGAAVGGDVCCAGTLNNADVALVEPGTGVLAEDEVTVFGKRALVVFSVLCEG